eukprot:4697508-Lingulodinium_polyedra.AAC.1
MKKNAVAVYDALGACHETGKTKTQSGCKMASNKPNVAPWMRTVPDCNMGVRMGQNGVEARLQNALRLFDGP